MKRQEIVRFTLIGLLCGALFFIMTASVIAGVFSGILGFLFLACSFSYLQGNGLFPFMSTRTCVCPCGCKLNAKQCTISPFGTCTSCEDGNHKPPANLDLSNLKRLIKMHESIARHYKKIHTTRKSY